MTAHIEFDIPVYREDRYEQLERQGRIKISSNIETFVEGNITQEYEQLRREANILIADINARTRLAAQVSEVEDELRWKSEKLKNILAETIGSGIEPQTQWAAKQYCEIEEEIFKLKKQLIQLIDSPQFEEYRQIFTKFGFGYQLQGYLLGAIYPIEDFLKNGQPEIKIRKNRQTGKESKLKLSERRFMRAVGMSVVREDSGQKKKGKQSGSALCRKALWQWCFTRLEVSRNNPPLKFVYGQSPDAEKMSPAENLKRRKKGGTPVKLARQRVIARCIRELFKELCSIVKN